MVFIGEVYNGKLDSTRKVTVRLTEFEATVEGILSKVAESIGTTEHLILTDGQESQILDCEGTRGN